MLFSDFIPIKLHPSISYYELTCGMENSLDNDQLASTLFLLEYIYYSKKVLHHQIYVNQT